MSEEEIFHQALARTDPEERAAYLEQACGGDEVRRASIEALLRADVGATGFMERRPPVVAATVDVPVGEGPGTVIGPYKLLQEIGEGGMGTVFMAEQTEPVRRKVALKLVRPGMDSRQIVARFEAERQALAMMDHPNIARVLDAGTTPTGRPYFVMELVKGVPITDYCDQNHLSPRERLELFVPVCQAVQHAHQKGIIHRDLKPSNVLVARYDDRPVPKVIDFGVAKATGPRLTERTLFTQYGQLVGTLEYMSPEQAAFNALDIDTRSDIYSLGVLLYELLTGSTPFERTRLRTAAFDEVLRIIREEEPPRPSTRLSTTEELPSISAKRGMEPRQLSGLLRRELDWVVMKALEKDRNRRYESAGAFAADVRRFLDDEPVQACPPSRSYRLRKYAHKHKKVLATAAVFVALLVAAAGISIALASWALRERDHAEERKREAETNLKSALGAVDQMLTRIGDVTLVNVPQMEPVRRELLQDALRFYQKFLSQEAKNAIIRSELAIAYRRMGTIHSLLGQRTEAEESYRQALTLGEQLRAESPDDPTTLDNLADTHKDLGAFYFDTVRWSQAEKALRQGVALREQLERRDPAYPEGRGKLAGIHATLVGLYRYMGQLDQAEAAFQTCKGLMEDLLSRDAKNARYALILGNCYQNVALVYHAQDRAVEAESANLKALDLYQQLVRDQPEVVDYQKRVAKVYNNLGLLYAREGKASKADAAYQQSVARHETILREHPKVVAFQVDVGGCYGNMAHHVRQSRSPEESLPWTARAIDVLAPVLEKDPLNRGARSALFEAHLARTMALRRLGRDEEAAKDWKRALELSAGQSDVTMRLWRPSCLAHLGEHVQAATEMETLLTEGKAQPVNVFQFGCYYVCCSGAATQDVRLPPAERQKLADQYVRRGVELLRRAQAAGYFRDPARLARMKENKDLDAARGREEFKTFLAELEAKQQESRGKDPQSETRP